MSYRMAEQWYRSVRKLRRQARAERDYVERGKLLNMLAHMDNAKRNPRNVVEMERIA